MKATAAPAIEHSSSSQASHDQNKCNSVFFGPAAENETPFFAPRIQTKLTIGSPGDKYEQEADSVADRVVQRLSNPQAAAPALQRKCTDCEEKEKLQRKEAKKPGIMRQIEPEEEPLQTKAALDSPASPSPSLDSRLSSAKDSGAVMDKNTRQSMETAFGQDFSRVRIHTNSDAVQMNRELNARAFTHGRDIYFNAGEYSPGSTEGRRLLAHELVHVGQQRGGRNLSIVQMQRRPTRSMCNPSMCKLKPSNNSMILGIKWSQQLSDAYWINVSGNSRIIDIQNYTNKKLDIQIFRSNGRLDRTVISIPPQGFEQVNLKCKKYSSTDEIIIRVIDGKGKWIGNEAYCLCPC